jgi:hypothetical protein
MGLLRGNKDLAALRAQLHRVEVAVADVRLAEERNAARLAALDERLAEVGQAVAAALQEVADRQFLLPPDPPPSQAAASSRGSVSSR